MLNTDIMLMGCKIFVEVEGSPEDQAIKLERFTHLMKKLLEHYGADTTLLKSPKAELRQLVSEELRCALKDLGVAKVETLCSRCGAQGYRDEERHEPGCAWGPVKR